MKQLLALLLFLPSLCLAQDEGCTYISADNYNPLALIDDGSCTFQGGIYYRPTTVSTALFDPCGGDGLLRDEATTSSSWTIEQYKEALTQHIEDMGYGKVLIIEMHQEFVSPEFDGYGLDWTSNSTVGIEWSASCNYGAFEAEWIPSITIAFTNPCMLSECTGCTDSEALNYSSQATQDDGSCFYPADLCGMGTTWDMVSGSCVVANPVDVDFDMCVGVGDVLEVLANFGACFYPSLDACEDETQVTFEGYDYSIAPIGAQCWFSENLRYLPSVSPSTDVSSTTPRAYVYGYDGTVIADAMELPHYEFYGALYNYPALIEWNLCPSGWSVPTDSSWMVLETFLGMPDSELDLFGQLRGTADSVGTSIKGDFESLPNWNGAVNSLFQGKPGGFLNGSTNTFQWFETHAWWWSTSIGWNSGGITRKVVHNSSGIDRFPDNRNHGFSVRCIKD